MYVVYKIENKINGKVYIGSSINYLQRWRQHKTDAFNLMNYKYNYPLYQAMRKYGLENFEFSIIGKDYSSIEEMQLEEHKWILYYDSVNKGYNQTYNTDSNHIASENMQKYLKECSCKCAKVDENENIIEIYSSYQEASRMNGNNNIASSIRKVCKGLSSSYNGEFYRDLDENNKVIPVPFRSYKNRKAIIGISIENPDNIVYFESILSASKQLHLDRQSIGKCIKGEKRYTTVGKYIWRLFENGNIIENSINIEELIENYNKKYLFFNGERKTISEWARDYGICRQTLSKKIKDGFSLEEILSSLSRKG